ncbi:MAG TPA: phosphate ABC transporter substrate-binding protein PstS [Gemmatimonadales bacterium]|nr:phosphate ABC transporter substrate-binding protein PstS [Gemmatimonadales bacterium]
MRGHFPRWCVTLGALALACSPRDKAGRAADGAPSAAATGAILTGAGATFPNPIYSKWFDAYARETGVRINYQSIGSGGGIRQYTEGTVDFGASDGPMTDEQIAAVHGDVLHVPTVLGAVVATYNLPALGGKPLRFDGPTLADIFLGRITKWNDTRLASLNPGVALPAEDILVVHRSDGSGTTFIFTDFLSKVSPEWQSRVGHATSVEWPVGLGGKGNEGVTQQVKQSEGAIGYVELIYALSNGLPAAEIRNPAGQFVAASLRTVTAAAAGVSFGPDADFRVSITNAPGAESYPIASFTWLLIHPGEPDAPKHKALRAFLAWMLEPTAQRMAADLHYAPLPVGVIEAIQRRLGSS